jgi:hypothetical protein
MAFDYVAARNAGYSDEEIAAHLAKSKGFDIAGAKKAGYDDAEIVNHLITPPKQETPKRSTLDDILDVGNEGLRQIGLTARAGAKGAAAIPLLAGNALYGGINAGANALGFDAPIKNSATGYFDELLDRNFPIPRNSTERVVQDVASSIGGAGATAFAAKRLAGVPDAARRFFSDDMAAQVNAAAAGAGAAGLAREGGLSPLSQGGIGLLAGVIAPTAQTAAVTAAKVPLALGGQFTQAGRELSVGAGLNHFAEAPARTVDRLKTGYPTYVEGSVPTAGQAALDRGLMAAENFVKGLGTTTRAKFANQFSGNNAARMQLLGEVDGMTPAAIRAAQADRTSVTKPLREGAFANRTEANLSPIDEALFSIKNGETGTRKSVEDAVGWVESRLTNMGAKAYDPAHLYELRKDIVENLIRGKYDKEGASFGLAKSELTKIVKAIDDSIEPAAKGYRNYMDTYRTMSRPINRMEGTQKLKYDSTDTVIDETTNFASLSQPKWERNLGKLLEDQDYVKSLDPKHLDALTRISQDLNRAAQSTSTPMRLSGSDTASNISTFGALAKILGGKDANNPALQSIANKFSWLTRLTDKETNELLADALLDPKLALRLMQKANTMNAQSVSNILKMRATTLGYGQASGALD